ncbi:MAG: DUF6364 family protein [Imperialibacter sp.]|uniref:DUF6364 family protein n=1 Tax=Imperialibacter sp. TaxID=2038411 RepID=UPI0030D6FEA1|tara:strand:+ start:79 stop:339 length:261 start_codon:yes stop_codon:yes gene_type:complete
MDAKITLSFDASVIASAKAFAEENNISLSRLTEYLYRQMTSRHYQSLEDLEVSQWVMMVADGQAEYKTSKPRKAAKKEYYESRKKK